MYVSFLIGISHQRLKGPLYNGKNVQLQYYIPNSMARIYRWWGFCFRVMVVLSLVLEGANQKFRMLRVQFLDNGYWNLYYLYQSLQFTFRMLRVHSVLVCKFWVRSKPWKEHLMGFIIMLMTLFAIPGPSLHVVLS